MKKGFLLLLLFCSVMARAQSLKEALYSGKLKNTPGTMIRKGDDLSSKMDTATRKPSAVDTAVAKAPVLTVDAATIKVATQSDTAVATSTENKNNVSGSTTDTSALGVAGVAGVAVTTAAPAVSAPPAPKDNTALWKEHMNTVISALKTEALPSKKVKKETYFILVSYAIDTDGQVAINDVSVTPENAFLQQQVKDRVSVDVPKLNPVQNSSGTPRKVTKKYSFTLTKE